MVDDVVQKAFISKAKDQATGILAQPHIGAETKAIVKDLLTIIETYERQALESTGQSADVRLARKKLEQSKAETRAAEAKAESAKQLILSLIEDIKTINNETLSILKRHTPESADADSQSATKIRSSIQRMTETITRSSAK
ncbi:MAG: hypothetical protein BroJett040_21700 [Oligoflexia bacterium]|nr:MAG: hypothetical protein BroJett040_21700 [Oligoflexia bacterium]